MTLPHAILSFLTFEELNSIRGVNIFGVYCIKGQEGVSVFRILRDRKEKLVSFFNKPELLDNMTLYNFIYHNVSADYHPTLEFCEQTIEMNSDQYNIHCRKILDAYLQNDNDNSTVKRVTLIPHA